MDDISYPEGNMGPPLIQPLSDEHRQLADKVLQSIVPTLDLLARCQACGVDTAEMEQQIRDQEARARAVKQYFFPGHP